MQTYFHAVTNKKKWKSIQFKKKNLGAGMMRVLLGICSSKLIQT